MMGQMKLVLSQSHQNDPKRRDTEQELVASLLMQDRIEVILIEDVAHLENDSTDALCIQGIRGNMLVVAWHHTTDCIEHLRGLGIVGKFDGDDETKPKLPIALPAGQYDAMQRRIVCLDLCEIVDPSNARQQILTLLREGVQASREIPSPISAVAIDQRVSPPSKPIKLMPKRGGVPTSADNLDRLLDEFDGANL
jgi:hypothetical protein